MRALLFKLSMLFICMAGHLHSHAQKADWQCIGPDTMPAIGGDSSGFLSYTQGVGRTHCIRFHPDYDGINNNTVYIGTPRGGLWQSTNGMNHWEEMNTSQLPNIGIADLAFDPSDKNHLYIATGDADNGLNPNEAADGTEDTQCRGIFESMDGGKSWSNTPTGTWHDSSRQPVSSFWKFPSKKVMHRMYIYSMNPKVMGALIYEYNHNINKYISYFYRSADKGMNWHIAFTVRGERFRDMETKPGADDVIYISGDAIYKSMDAGVTWQKITSEKFPADSLVTRCKVAVCASAPHLLYALIVTGRNSKLFISNDEGATFEEVGHGTGSPAWRTSLAVDPNNSNSVFYSGGTTIYKFSKQGERWINTMAGEKVHADIHELAFSPDGKRLYTSSDGGVYVTESHASTTPLWQYISNGIGNAMVWRLDVSANGDAVVAGLQDCGTIVYNPHLNINHYSTSWAIVRGGDGAECFFGSHNDSVLYYTDGQNNIFGRSEDGGRHWTNLNPTGEPGNYLKPATRDPSNYNVLYAGYHNVHKSTDAGRTWKPISDFTAMHVPPGDRLSCIAPAPSDARIIYAAFPNPAWSDNPSAKLFRTHDGGATWSDITAGLTGVQYTSITSIAVDPNDADLIYVGFRGGWDFKVMRSASGGLDADWENFSEDLPKEADVNCIVIDKRKKGSIYIGTHCGVFARKASGSGWQAFTDGSSGPLPNLHISDLAISYSTSELYAATVGRGVWKTTIEADKKRKKNR